MKWILAILCGLALQAGAITNGVFATKSPYVVEAATMPFNLWTNSVLWLTAESPVLNAGTTNAEWICYAKNCAGNFIQTTIASQPPIVTNLGNKVFSFDGQDYVYMTNDYSLNYPTGSMPRTMMCWVKPSNTSGGGLICYGESATSKESTVVLQVGNTLALSRSGGNITLSTNSVSTISWSHVAITYDGTNLIGWINGVQQSTSAFTLNTGYTLAVQVGRREAGLSYFAGLLDSPVILNRALSSTEVFNAYSTRKAGFGL
jgi:hypothetical protein